MVVEARMYVESVQRFAYDPNQVSITMRPVTRGAHNKTWASATPSGEVKMSINNPGAADFFVKAFEQKQEFRVRFTAISPDSLADGHAFEQFDGYGCALCGIDADAHNEPKRSELVAEMKR